MSAYTALCPTALQAFLADHAVGALLDSRPIHDGVENSNYRLRTERGEYVLTLFESLTAAELPPYLALMTGLAEQGLPCPRAVPDRNGRLLGELHGKPALLAARLPGAGVTDPAPHHCRVIGAALAVVHGVGRQLPAMPANRCDGAWRRSIAAQLRLPRDCAALLADELAFQDKQNPSALPQGLVHGDLFRDNVLFEGDRLTGLLDWYEAGSGAWLYDVAVTANDWCGEDPDRLRALLDGYATIRRFTDAEQDALPAMLRAAALRFWLSRLLARQTPRSGELVQTKDPEEFKRLLLHRRDRDAAPAI
ncbi:homoserine kinase [Methylogaea oryzae]|uniref:Homoserine kinase n=1 Tax=Methylogaea oryzae TaxID=1295382 RepID=A0A8D5AH61_9GAMM|nr:homoserine kinase [Methylogaea oryzae]BBL69941.1 homoserine kinase [Methylogaea oryzae]